MEALYGTKELLMVSACGYEFETVHYGLTKWRDESDQGPWDDEPDRAYWIDTETGLPCLIRRGPAGALCGYVAVPKSHPFYGLGYSDLPVNIDVHGCLTYAGSCQEDNRETGICHITEGDDPAWWFGFDCAHSWDRCPMYDLGDHDATYKGIGYVRFEVRRLAHQLHDAGMVWCHHEYR